MRTSASFVRCWRAATGRFSSYTSEIRIYSRVAQLPTYRLARALAWPVRKLLGRHG
jgi:hypothetical protein